MARRAPRARETAFAGLKVGVSACILGQEVRYDGRHKLDARVRDALGEFAQIVPVCPEVEVGMGVPRPPVNLVRIGRAVRMIEPATGADHTAAMRAWAQRRAEMIARAGLCGFVVQARSPSCGKEHVRIHHRDGTPPSEGGRGLFTAALMTRLPHLPVVEGERLHDPRALRDFVERVLAYRSRGA